MFNRHDNGIRTRDSTLKGWRIKTALPYRGLYFFKWNTNHEGTPK